MRAKEFIISLGIDDMGQPDIKMRPVEHEPEQLDPEPLEPEYDLENDPDAPEADDMDDAWTYPQQQELELQKASLGKRSVIAAQLVDNPEDGEIS